jgi:acyl phosphate:glycerol-3-phosphate acyltransferase
MTASHFVFLAVGYALGTIPFGYMIARVKGIDIRKVGSGNIGATNVARVLGWKAGLIAFALDVLKGSVPVLIFRSVTGSLEFSFFAGVMAVFGHMTSPFLRFKGGKGIATALGLLLAAFPLFAAISLGTFVAVFAASRYVSLSSVVAASVLILLAIFGGMPPALSFVTTALSLFVIFKHRSNLKRLVDHEEPKFSFKSQERHEESHPLPIIEPPQAVGGDG